MKLWNLPNSLPETSNKVSMNWNTFKCRPGVTYCEWFTHEVVPTLRLCVSIFCAPDTRLPCVIIVVQFDNTLTRRIVFWSGKEFVKVLGNERFSETKVNPRNQSGSQVMGLEWMTWCSLTWAETSCIVSIHFDISS